MHEVLVYRLGGLNLPRKSVVRLTDRPDMPLDVYRGRKTTILQLFFIAIIKCSSRLVSGAMNRNGVLQTRLEAKKRNLRN